MIPPKEALGKGRQNYLDSLPEEFKEDVCRCKIKSSYREYAYESARTIKLPSSGPVGILVHVTCRKPTNLWNYIETCENCEYYYIVDKYPDRELLCSGCKSVN